MTVLLFEPRRLVEEDPTVDPMSPMFTKNMPPLLDVVRDLGRRSALIKTLVRR